MTQNSKQQSFVPRQVKHSYYSQSPCAKAQMTNVWKLAPKINIQNQKNISKIAYFTKQTLLIHILTFQLCAKSCETQQGSVVCSILCTHNITYFSCKVFPPEEFQNELLLQSLRFQYFGIERESYQFRPLYFNELYFTADVQSQFLMLENKLGRCWKKFLR